MKQILIVLSATVLVVLGYVFYSDWNDSDSGQAKKPRPQSKQPADRTAQRPKSNPGTDRKVQTMTTADGTEVEQIVEGPKGEFKAAEEYLEATSASWRDMVTDETLVSLEDAWDIDPAGVDYDADVLVTMELKSGRRIEISKMDWRRYLCLTLGQRLVDAKTLWLSGRAHTARYNQPFGFTDSQWEAFFAARAEMKGLSVEAHKEILVAAYGTSEAAMMKSRRDQIEGVFGFFPSVDNSNALPDVVRNSLELDEDRNFVTQMVVTAARARADLDDPENISRMANLLEPLTLSFPRIIADDNFRRTWSFLDENLPENVISACFTGNVLTETVLPPWLQPDGEVEYVTVEEMYPLIEEQQISPTERHGLLRHLVWHKVLQAVQEDDGHALTPEDSWGIHAEEVIARSKTALSMKMIIGGFYEYPSMAHYRGVQRVLESFKTSLPEDWKSDETQRAFYDKHRVFVESWQPYLELILFTPRRLDTDMSVDWEYARKEAEDMRAKVISGEVDFSSFRISHHNELKELFRKQLGDEAALSFEENFRMGQFGETVRNQEALLKESGFNKMMNLASVVRNSVVRLDRGEISPVWKSPIGYVLVRVHGAGLSGLEGEYDDFESQTQHEYELTMFYQWANEALSGAKQVVVN